VLVQRAVSDENGSRQTILLARGTPTIKLWSFDARSGGLIQAIRGKRIQTSMEKHLWMLTAAALVERRVAGYRLRSNWRLGG
jgi:hypothetical protein